MQRYRSGHNGADSKSVCAQAHEGSNPSLCAKNTRNRKIAGVFFLSVVFWIWESIFVQDKKRTARRAVLFLISNFLFDFFIKIATIATFGAISFARSGGGPKGIGNGAVIEHIRSSQQIAKAGFGKGT